MPHRVEKKGIASCTCTGMHASRTSRLKCACTGDAMDTGSSQQHVLRTVLHWRDVLDRAVSVARLLTGQRHSTCLRTAMQLCQFIQHLTARRSSSCR